MTDVNALIERWQGGDERAAETLYYHHREQTFRLAYGLLGDQADAEEAAQDALNYALTNIRRFHLYNNLLKSCSHHKRADWH